MKQQELIIYDILKPLKNAYEKIKQEENHNKTSNISERRDKK